MTAGWTTQNYEDGHPGSLHEAHGEVLGSGANQASSPFFSHVTLYIHTNANFTLPSDCFSPPVSHLPYSESGATAKLPRDHSDFGAGTRPIHVRGETETHPPSGVGVRRGPRWVNALGSTEPERTGQLAVAQPPVAGPTGLESSELLSSDSDSASHVGRLGHLGTRTGNCPSSHPGPRRGFGSWRVVLSLVLVGLASCCWSGCTWTARGCEVQIRHGTRSELPPVSKFFPVSVSGSYFPVPLPPAGSTASRNREPECIKFFCNNSRT